jgi:hypothetical protein
VPRPCMAIISASGIKVLRWTRAVLFLSLALLLGCSEPQTGRVELSLHPLEMLATRNGPKIVVRIEGKPVGELSAAVPKLLVSAAAETVLTFCYIGPKGESTEVTWTQAAKSNDKRLVVVQPWRQKRHKKPWHVVAWAMSEGGSSILEQASNTVTDVSPIWWTLNREGDLRSTIEPEIVTLLRNKKIAVWPAIQGLDANGLHTFLTNPARRSRVAALISGEAQKHGAQGVNMALSR